MSVNSFTYPLQYEDLGPQTGPEITLNIGRIDEAVNSETDFEGIIGKSSGLRRVLEMVETVAWGDSTVLLLGETGTGKEIIARAIHSHSPRRGRPFVKLNCAPSLRGCSKANYLGMSGDPSPVRSHRRSGGSSLHIRVRCSWMKLATSLSSSSRSFFVSCRSGNSSA
jgi:hypothetical protein